VALEEIGEHRADEVDAAQLWFLLISGSMVIPAALLLVLRWLDRGWSTPVGSRVPGGA
jgi:hypothetical protein